MTCTLLIHKFNTFPIHSVIGTCNLPILHGNPFLANLNITSKFVHVASYINFWDGPLYNLPVHVLSN